MSLKALIAAISVIVLLLGLLIFAEGLPNERIHFYNNDSVVCRDRNTEWSLYYTEHECWNVALMPLNGNIGEVK